MKGYQRGGLWLLPGKISQKKSQRGAIENLRAK
jgi:hypothetical protein